ncbi:hypothetical protein [Roseovarius sp. D22-M7]|uniref:hypothetical protein n=1 Tax=Roseovarius sp. D22-M7 TaxID=3127116 RepID=UPI00300FEA22
MCLDKLFGTMAGVSCAPSGTVNVRRGNPVDGPGGRWIPCASAISDGAYVSCIFEVGPGRRQVCAVNDPTNDIDDALSRAMELARTAAA